jgi:recombination protein RecA
VVEKSGAWFGFEGERIGQGRENAKQFLRDHADVSRKIEAKVLAHHGIRREVGPPALVAGAVNGAGAGAASPGAAAASGATVHAFSPQPKPSSDKKR